MLTTRKKTVVYLTSGKNVANSGEHLDQFVEVFLESFGDLKAVNVSLY